MRFVIEGPPRTAKNSQQIARTRRGTPFVTKGHVARDWQRDAVRQLTKQYPQQVAGTKLETGAVCIKVDRKRGIVTWFYNVVTAPVNLRALIYRDKRTGDTVGYLQAICDALEAAHVIANDKQIETFDGSRPLVDRERPRVEIELTPLPG